MQIVSTLVSTVYMPLTEAPSKGCPCHIALIALASLSSKEKDVQPSCPWRPRGSQRAGRSRAATALEHKRLGCSSVGWRLRSLSATLPLHGARALRPLLQSPPWRVARRIRAPPPRGRSPLLPSPRLEHGRRGNWPSSDELTLEFGAAGTYASLCQRAQTDSVNVDQPSRRPVQNFQR